MNRVRGKRRGKGFSLIELILVAALLSFIGVALYSTFAQGMNIWQRVTAQIDAEDINFFLEKISRELRGSFQLSGIAFRGTADWISFPAVIQVRERKGFRKEIGEVEYAFHPENAGVYRRYRSYSDIYEDRDGRQEKVIGGVQSLGFQYYYYDLDQKDYLWIDAWQAAEETLGEQEKKILPVAVRILIGIRGERGSEQFVKTVSVPSGCCVTEGSEDEDQTTP